MTWREMPPPSVFERLAARGAEREFALRVERAFPVDPAAVARVRNALVGQVSAATAPRALPFPRFRLMVSWPRGASVAMAVGVIALASIVMAGGRAGGTHVAAGPAVERLTQAVVLDRSAARLKNVLATIPTSDPATVATMLGAVRADFVNVEAVLQRPGADLSAAAPSLWAQAGDLATMAVLVPVEDRGLYDEVSGQLDRILATLPDPSDGGSTHPGGGNGNPNGNAAGDGNGGGNGNGNGGGDGNGGGNGNGNGGGNGKPDATPNGGNSKPHPTPRTNDKPHANASPGANHTGGNGNGKPTDP
jgi:uncharacterized membrane protein YgcG